MPASTRTPSRQKVPNPGFLTAAVLGVLGLAAAGWAVYRGASVAAVLLVAVCAVGIGTVAGLLPRLWSAVLFAVVLIGGIAVVRWTEPRALFAWFLLLGTGLLVGTRVVWRRQQDRRPAGALTAALRAVHDEGGDVVETVDPPADQVRALVRALDGGARTGVSVFRGSARLDVGGDASGAMVCFRCDDVRARPRPTWSALSSGPDAWRTDEVDLRVAGVDAHLPAGAITSLAPTLVALDAFLAGRPTPDLPWRTDPDVDDLRALFDTYS